LFIYETVELNEINYYYVLFRVIKNISPC